MGRGAGRRKRKVKEGARWEAVRAAGEREESAETVRGGPGRPPLSRAKARTTQEKNSV